MLFSDLKLTKLINGLSSAVGKLINCNFNLRDYSFLIFYCGRSSTFGEFIFSVLPNAGINSDTEFVFPVSSGHVRFNVGTTTINELSTSTVPIRDVYGIRW